MMNIPIWINLVTKDNFAVAKQTILSMQDQIDEFGDRAINLLILDKSKSPILKDWMEQQNFDFQKCIYYGPAEIRELEKEFISSFNLVHYDFRFDSVQRARIQMQCAIKKLIPEVGRDIIIWQIDDEMLFKWTIFNAAGKIEHTTYPRYFEEIRKYRLNYPNVDAAIGLYSYSPPIPILLNLQSQLNGLLNPQDKRNGKTAHINHQNNYHDLYAGKSGNGFSQLMDEDIPEKINLMLKGAAVTCPITYEDYDTEHFVPQPSCLRGGNFVIFNLDIAILIPHPSFCFDNIIARRSDMICAWLYQKMGYNISTSPLHLVHNRQFEEINIDKMGMDYVADALGAIAFRYLSENFTRARQRLNEHMKHVEGLISTIGELVGKYPNEHLVELHQKLGGILGIMSSWDLGQLEKSLEQFKVDCLELSENCQHK